MAPASHTSHRKPASPQNQPLYPIVAMSAAPASIAFGSSFATTNTGSVATSHHASAGARNVTGNAHINGPFRGSDDLGHVTSSKVYIFRKHICNQELRGHCEFCCL